MVHIDLTREELLIAWENAKKACIGGISRIRSGSDRAARLLEDQFVGQIGNLAGCKWFYGNIEDYLNMRAKANANPTKGDGGSDLTNLRVDFKTSVMRRSQNPFDYTLLVRPAERHSNWVYILILLPKFVLPDLTNGLTVHIVGWLEDKELPEYPDTDGIFEGAYAVPVRLLHPAREKEYPLLTAV